MRRAVSQLTTRRLDGRSAVAVAVRAWKADVTRDLGGDLTRAQATILEAAAQSWIILQSIDDFIARQPSLVTRKRALLPVVRERMAIAEGLAKNLDRLGLERRVRDVPTWRRTLRRRGHWRAKREKRGKPRTAEVRGDHP
jgi:hypothetical protein